MNKIIFSLRHFFTHKDFLPDVSQIPGTLYTPMQIFLEILFLGFIVWGAIWLSKKQTYIKTVLTGIWMTLVLWEVAIDVWDSLAGARNAFDLRNSLPLYPCSLFMFMLPLVIWGKGLLREMAYGYICTLGLAGALINFLYPIARLQDYSCISFPAFHTFFYHGSMLFAALFLLMAGMHRLHQFEHWWVPFLASVPGLIFSIPANLVNYSKISSDYMYFTGQHMLAKTILGTNVSPVKCTVIMYLIYLFGPVLFYLLPWGTLKIIKKYNIFFLERQ